MSFRIDSFVDLINKYPRWDALSSFLTSPEGGSLRIIEKTSLPFHSIIRYVKEKSDFTKPWVKDARSIVWNTLANRPLCFAPVKSESPSGSDSIETTPFTPDSVYISEFIDGSMINAFRPCEGNAFISTRTNIGAKVSFYDFYKNPSPTFEEMFNDALSDFGGYQRFLNMLLLPGQFASFVLQHPMNRIVSPVYKPRVFLIHIGTMGDNGSAYITTKPLDFPSMASSLAVKVYESDKDYKELCKRNGFAWQGFVYQDKTSSRRWRLRNPYYTIVRTLRGAESSALKRFMRLRSQGLVKEYLKTYPEESSMFWSFEQTWRHTTQKLFDAYIHKNKVKTKEMKDIPLEFRPHVYALHGLYLNSINEKAPISISKESVINYVNKLSVEDQVSLIGSIPVYLIGK